MAVVVHEIIVASSPVFCELACGLGYSICAERIAASICRDEDVQPCTDEVRTLSVQKVAWIDNMDARLSANICDLGDLVVAEIDASMTEPASEEVGAAAEIAPQDAARDGMDFVSEFCSDALYQVPNYRYGNHRFISLPRFTDRP